MKDENEGSGSSGMLDLNSKFWRTFLTLIAFVLIFAGPTYVTYVLNALDIAYLASVIVGIVLFAVGLVLLFYLIRKKVII